MGLNKEHSTFEYVHCTQDSSNWISIVQWIPSELTCMFRIIISHYYTNNVIITGNDDIDIAALTKFKLRIWFQWWTNVRCLHKNPLNILWNLKDKIHIKHHICILQYRLNWSTIGCCTLLLVLLLHLWNSKTG